jgi:hypothetical protein
MHILNIHEREFSLPLAKVGALIDSLASREDRLWPNDRWSPMRFDRPLAVGAVGGHGPVGYSVEEYEAGRRILFRFTAPRGFNGTHYFEAVEHHGGTTLRHTIEMDVTGQALLSWSCIIRSLHDACIEDGFDHATVSLGIELLHPVRWSIYVRILRSVMQIVSKSKRR